MRSWLNRLLDYEAIDGRGICPTYLHRWRLLRIPGLCKVYLHHFVGNDWSVDPHDHPCTFWNIGIKGQYFEDQWARPWHEKPSHTRFFRAPWFRTFGDSHTHRVRAFPQGPAEQRQMEGRTPGAWTLCVVFKKTRDWGFWWPHRGLRHWVPSQEYIDGAGHDRRDC